MVGKKEEGGVGEDGGEKDYYAESDGQHARNTPQQIKVAVAINRLDAPLETQTLRFE